MPFFWCAEINTCYNCIEIKGKEKKMLFFIGLGILLALALVLVIIENTAPVVKMEITFVHIILFVIAGMFAWGAQEYIATRWFDLYFIEGFWVRLFQVLHVALAVAITYRGFLIGLVISFFIGVYAFIQWLITG